MAKVTTCREAIANFEKAKGVVATEADKVSLLIAQIVCFMRCCRYTQQWWLAGRAERVLPSHREARPCPGFAQGLQVGLALPPS